MTTKTKKKLIVGACTLLLISIGGFMGFQHLKNVEYEQLKLTFVEVDSDYEIGSELNGRDFIQYSSTNDIDIPNIISNQEGKQSFLYIVHGKYGVTREFNLVLNFADKQDILLELTTSELTLQEGTEFNYKDYIKTATVNNEKVEVEVTIPKEITKVGKHEVVYAITLDSGKEKKEILIVTVEKKEEVKETNTQQQTNEQQQNTPQPNIETPIPTPTPQPEPQQSTHPAQFFASGEYGGIDGAMNACYSVMNAYGGSCIPADRNSDGSWPGYNYTP